jgi:hypothetical protein
VLKPQRYQIRNFAGVGGYEGTTYLYFRQAMFAVPELKGLLQAMLVLEDFIKKFSGGDVFLLRSAYKVYTFIPSVDQSGHFRTAIHRHEGISGLLWS